MDYLNFVLFLAFTWITIPLLHSIEKMFIKTNRKDLPPGPYSLPIFGNFFSLGTKPHISLTKLAQKHGPLMTLQLGHVPTVIISSAEMAKEALQENDISFSNRMVVDGVRALGHHEKSVVWLPVGSQWRNLRKICNSHVFSTSRLDASQSLRRNKVKDLLINVEKRADLGEAVNISQAAFTTTLNLLSSTFFSVDLGDPSSEFARELKKTTRDMIEELGKPNFADYFPTLQMIDPQGFRRRTSVHFGKIMGLFKTIIDKRLQEKNSPSSTKGNDVLDSLLGINQNKAKEIEPSNIPNLLLDLFGGGIDTTSSTLEWAMAELLHNPEKLKKAKAELYEIIGQGNSMEEPDIVRLPYLQAVIKETFRLHPAVPFLIPRKVDSDVKLAGFTVPKDAQVLINVWAIGRDPKVWDNPNSFVPERFLGSQIDIKGHDFELIPFGAGRRICPGLPLAIRMLHLMLGSLINGFDWKLEGEITPEKLDMEEKFGISLQKAQGLHVIPVRV